MMLDWVARRFFSVPDKVRTVEFEVNIHALNYTKRIYNVNKYTLISQPVPCVPAHYPAIRT
jgi:hypothetical protein